MTHLHLDFETRSRLDIKKVGLDRYAKSAEVLMLAWAVDDGEPELWCRVPTQAVYGYLWTVTCRERLFSRSCTTKR
jgi:hypothetical protein